MGGEPGIYERMCKASAGEERPDAQGHKESSRKQTREPPVEVRLAFLTLSTLILPLLPPSLPFSLLFFFPRLSSTYYVTTREE